MHHPTDRIVPTMSLVSPVEHWLEGEIAEWFQEESI